MQLSEQYYADIPNITSLEKFTIALARDILVRQKDKNFNPQQIDYIDIDTNEDEQSITINFNNIPCENSNGEIIVKSLFSELFQAGTGPYPFNRKTRLGAWIHAIMYQHEKELDININKDEEVKINYTFTSGSDLGAFPLIISGSMANLRLVVTQAGPAQVTQGKEYLEGTFA